MSFFSTVKRSYADVSTEGGVNTEQFLEATEGLVKLFDLLGSSAFKVVQNDLSGNIEKIRARFLASPVDSATLEALVANECKEAGADKKKKKATEALMWLLRGLDFTAKALRRSRDNDKEELSVSFTKAYENSLRQFHSFVVRPIFAVAMKACPYRTVFYEKLTGTGDPKQTDAELEKWLAALEAIVKELQTFLNSGDYTKGL